MDGGFLRIRDLISLALMAGPRRGSCGFQGATSAVPGSPSRRGEPMKEFVGPAA